MINALTDIKNDEIIKVIKAHEGSARATFAENYLKSRAYACREMENHPELARKLFIGGTPVLGSSTYPIETKRKELESIFTSDVCRGNDPEKVPFAEFAASTQRFREKCALISELDFMSGKISTAEFCAEISLIAEVILKNYLFRCEHEALKTHHFPEKPSWGIFALGEFGGIELVTGSKIELLFIYDLPSWRSEHPEVFLYYEKLVQMLILPDEEGNPIFDFDMTLRPYSKNSPLPLSKATFREYYSANGPAFFHEKLALAKLRHVFSNETGQDLKNDIIRSRDGFVYDLTPPDLDALFNIRKKNIDTHSASGSTDLIFSQGFSADIEYITRLFQLRFGYEHPEIRKASTSSALDSMAEEDVVSTKMKNDLKEAFMFYKSLSTVMALISAEGKISKLPPEESAEERLFLWKLNDLGIIEGTSSSFLKEKIDRYVKTVKYYFFHLAEFLR